jgi:nicotinate-nucleotide adenylyltransferase
MLRLALAGEPRFAIDERELAPGASGYTVDMLHSLRKEFADSAFVLLLGADQHAKLQTWHRWQELGKLARIAVFTRPGFSPSGTENRIEMKPLDISASDIRARLKRGESVQGLVPPAVAAYIAGHGLYR